MRIIVITPTFYPQVGGGEKYLQYLIRELTKKHEVIVITAAKIYKGKKHIDNSTVYYLPYQQVFGTEIISPLDIFRLLRKLKPDMIHGSGPSIVQDTCLILSKILKIPMVITYHADLNPGKIVSSLYTKISTQLILKNAHKIIVTSNKYFSILKQRKIPQAKLIVVPVGVEFTKFSNLKKNKNMIKREFHLEGKKTILFVGQLDKVHLYKRLDLLMDSLVLLKKQVGSVHLMIVGRGEFLPKYKSMSELLQIQSNISFHPNVTDSELPYYYSVADVFVLPSPTILEGFGMVLLEAMASGVPVITSDRCGGADAIEESNSGLLYKAFDIKDLSEKIINILTDDLLASKFGENGRKYSQNYDWTQIAKKIETVYKEILTTTK